MSSETPVLVGSDGHTPVRSLKYEVCPKCGAGPDQRFSSGGFGITHLICKCGYEFEGKLICPNSIQ